MLNKIFAAIGLGVTFDIASLINSDKISGVLGTNSTITERGFPFSYLKSAESTIQAEVPGTGFIFKNATFNLIFWIIVASIVIYILTWIFAKFSKLMFYLSLFAVIAVVLGIFLLT